MRPTAKGRRALAVARPLWTQAQRAVLQGVGTRAWADAQRHLTRFLEIAVDRRETAAPPGIANVADSGKNAGGRA